MFGYVKERAIAAAVSAALEVLRHKGHKVNGSVTISSSSLTPLLGDLPDDARDNLERYIGDGLQVDFQVVFPKSTETTQ